MNNRENYSYRINENEIEFSLYDADADYTISVSYSGLVCAEACTDDENKRIALSKSDEKFWIDEADRILNISCRIDKIYGKIEELRSEAENLKEELKYSDHDLLYALDEAIHIETENMEQLIDKLSTYKVIKFYENIYK